LNQNSDGLIFVTNLRHEQQNMLLVLICIVIKITTKNYDSSILVAK